MEKIKLWYVNTHLCRNINGYLANMDRKRQQLTQLVLSGLLLHNTFHLVTLVLYIPDPLCILTYGYSGFIIMKSSGSHLFILQVVQEKKADDV